MLQTMTLDIHEVETRLIELLPLINSGNEIIITQAKKPIVRLAPLRLHVQERTPGLHAGMGWVSEDFDAPLPDEFWLGGK